MNKLADKIKNKKPVTIAFFGDSVTQGCFELRVAEGKRLSLFTDHGKHIQKSFSKFLNIVLKTHQ